MSSFGFAYDDYINKQVLSILQIGMSPQSLDKHSSANVNHSMFMHGPV